jgi:hypothetical protein
MMKMKKKIIVTVIDVVGSSSYGNKSGGLFWIKHPITTIAIHFLIISAHNLTTCHYQRAVSSDSTLVVVTYVMAAVCVVCALPLLIVLIQWQLRKCSAKVRGRHDSEAETVLTDSRWRKTLWSEQRDLF